MYIDTSSEDLQKYAKKAAFKICYRLLFKVYRIIKNANNRLIERFIGLNRQLVFYQRGKQVVLFVYDSL